jgi:hypothetical protein
MALVFGRGIYISLYVFHVALRHLKTMPAYAKNLRKLSQHRSIVSKHERRKRLEKFRKRSKSLVHKAKELAEQTDSYVGLYLIEKSGRCHTFTSHDPDWHPLSFNHLNVSMLHIEGKHIIN